MALNDSTLEELGLAPLWVRRGSAHGQAPLQGAQSAQSAQVGEADSAALLASDVASDTAPHTAPHTLPDATATSRAAPRNDREPASARDSEPARSAAFPDNEIAWFDDLPTQPSSRAPSRTADETADDTANRTTDDFSAPPVASLDWDALVARVAGCERCRLCEKRTQTVFGVGDRNADWMLIGEAPGENEDRQGEPFVGQAGKLLDNMLRSLSLARGENVYIANVLKCRPPGNRNPEPEEVARCEPYLQRQVALVKPKLIVALGRFAAQSLLKTDASISSLRGRVHAYEGVPVIVTYHPAYLLRSLHDKAKAWQDLCLARDTWHTTAASAAAAALAGQPAGSVSGFSTPPAAG